MNHTILEIVHEFGETELINTHCKTIDDYAIKIEDCKDELSKLQAVFAPAAPPELGSNTTRSPSTHIEHTSKPHISLPT